MHCVLGQNLTLMQSCIVGQMGDDPSVVVTGQCMMQFRRVLHKRRHDDNRFLCCKALLSERRGA